MYDIGKDEVKLREALQRSQDLFGNDATLLYDALLPSSMIEICKSNGKEEGGPWDPGPRMWWPFRGGHLLHLLLPYSCTNVQMEEALSLKWGQEPKPT